MKFLTVNENELIKVQKSDVEAAAIAGISLSTYLNNTYTKQVEEFNKRNNK